MGNVKLSCAYWLEGFEYELEAGQLYCGGCVPIALGKEVRAGKTGIFVAGGSGGYISEKPIQCVRCKVPLACVLPGGTRINSMEAWLDEVIASWPGL